MALLLLAVPAVSAMCTAPSASDPSYGPLSSATGTKPNDFGDYDGCLDGGFQHCILRANGWLSLTIGACVPADCGPSDVSNTSSQIWKGYIVQTAPDWAIAQALEGSSFSVTATCGNNRIPWSSGAVVTASALALLLAVVLAATVYTAIYPVSGIKAKSETGGAQASAGASVLDTILRGCSLTSTLPPLLGYSSRRAPSPVTAQLDSLDGVRVVSMCLVILGHSTGTFLFGAVNSQDVLKMLMTPSGQTIPSAELAVDSFFLLSGCLAAYFATKQLAKPVSAVLMQASTAGNAANHNGRLAALEEGVSELSSTRSFAGLRQMEAKTARKLCAVLASAWATIALRRYLRLLPSIAFFVAITAYLGPTLLADGPFAYEFQSDISVCSDHGWTDLVFLQNYIPAGVLPYPSASSSKCGAHTWYLATEFQLFVALVAPVSIAYILSPLLGWALVAAAGAGGVLSSFVVVYNKRLSALAFPTDGLTQITVADYYYQPWTRSPPFVIGLALGFALRSWEKRAQMGTDSESLPSAAKRGASSAGEPQPAADSSVVSDDAEAAQSLLTASEKQHALAGEASDVDDAVNGAAHRKFEAIERLAVQVLPTRTCPVTGRRTVDPVATAVLACALTVLGLMFYLPGTAYPASGGTATWSEGAQKFYTATYRTFWAAALGVLLYLCATGRGGCVTPLLSLPIWQPMARLSFWMYLIHEEVLNGLTMTVVRPLHYSPTELAQLYISACAFCALSAALLHLLVELPFAAAEKALFGGGSSSGSRRRGAQG